jgi:hypothetical protein
MQYCNHCSVSAGEQLNTTTKIPLLFTYVLSTGRLVTHGAGTKSRSRYSA